MVSSVMMSPLEGCAHLFARSMLPVTRLLSELGELLGPYPSISIPPSSHNFILTGMSTKDVDEVVLVGGTTRIPLVKQQLRYVGGCNTLLSALHLFSVLPECATGSTLIEKILTTK